jgi:cytochrome c biogenesis protein CcmG/thiol:disulfide interchange protein DsbE
VDRARHADPGGELNVRRAAVVLAVAVVALVLAEVLTSGSSAPARRSAPPLPAQVLVAPRATLAALKGRPAVVNFWASWCGPCRREAPEISRLAGSLGGRARLVGVDYSDAASGARAFILAHHWTFPILRDASGRAGERYGLGGLPTTFVLDRNGAIVKRLVGPQTAAAVLAALHGVT